MTSIPRSAQKRQQSEIKKSAQTYTHQVHKGNSIRNSDFTTEIFSNTFLCVMLPLIRGLKAIQIHRRRKKEFS